MPFCKDCRHYEAPPPDSYGDPWCMNPATMIKPHISPVTGEIEAPSPTLCVFARAGYATCGPDAQLFEASSGVAVLVRHPDDLLDPDDYYRLDCSGVQSLRFGSKIEAMRAFQRHVAMTDTFAEVWNIYGEVSGTGGAIRLAIFPGIESANYSTQVII